IFELSKEGGFLLSDNNKRRNVTEFPNSTRIARWVQLTETAIDSLDINRYITSVKELLKTVSGDEWLKIQWEFLDAMGLRELYGCDFNILPILKQIPPISDYVDVQSFLQHTLVESLLEKLEAGGTSLLLDVDKMKDTPAATLIPKILELRKNELDYATVPIIGSELVIYDVFMKETNREVIPDKGNSVLLENLWLTALGYEVLSKLDVGLQTDLKGLKRIQKAIDKIGTDLQFERVSNRPVPIKANMSEAMRELILKRASERNLK
ncbi:MAG: hypothetical protein RTV31_17255, partial [Candidatus Thorarchaeota archaeon]